MLFECFGKRFIRRINTAVAVCMQIRALLIMLFVDPLSPSVQHVRSLPRLRHVSLSGTRMRKTGAIPCKEARSIFYCRDVYILQNMICRDVYVA